MVLVWEGQVWLVFFFFFERFGFSLWMVFALWFGLGVRCFLLWRLLIVRRSSPGRVLCYDVPGKLFLKSRPKTEFLEKISEV